MISRVRWSSGRAQVRRKLLEITGAECVPDGGWKVLDITRTVVGGVIRRRHLLLV